MENQKVVLVPLCDENYDEAFYASIIEGLKDDIYSSNVDNNYITKENEQLKAENKQLKAEIEQLKAEIEQFKAENEQLKAKIKQLKAEN